MKDLAFENREQYFEALQDTIELLYRIRRASMYFHVYGKTIEALEIELDEESKAIAGRDNA